MSVLTKFEIGEMYQNRLGKYTVMEFMQDGKHMEVYCNYDGETRKFDILIAQLTIYNMGKEGIYEEIT